MKKNNANYKKGKWFEEKSLKTLERLNPVGTIIHSEKSIPTLSGGFRKVDIGINNPGEYNYIVLECKNSKHTVGIGALDQVQGIKNSVQAGKAALLVNGKVSRSVLREAKYSNVDVFNVIDAQDNRIRPHIQVKMLARFVWIKRFRYFLYFADQKRRSFGEPSNVFIQKNKTITDLVTTRWNGACLKEQEGVHSYVDENFYLVVAPNVGVKTAAVDKIEVEYEVVGKNYLTKIDLEKGRGVYDVLKKEFITSEKELSFGPISIGDVIKNGKETDNKKQPEGVAVNSMYRYIM